MILFEVDPYVFKGACSATPESNKRRHMEPSDEVYGPPILLLTF